MLSTWIQSKKDEEGFTLIELLVVVIIIGILAAIAIPVFLNQRESAWRSAVESDLRNVAVEMEAAATNAGGTYAGIPATASSSANVNVVLDTSSGTTQYCLSGTHTNLTAGRGSTAQPIIYDSDDGGLADNTAGC